MTNSYKSTAFATSGIVIVHYHSEETLLALLRQVVEDSSFPQENIVVVDNGSCGELAEEIARIAPRTTSLRLANPGYGAAMNAGVRQLPVDASRCIVMTHDVVLSADTLSKLLCALDQPSVGLVGPVLLDGSKPRPTVWSLGGSFTPISRRPYNIGRGHSWSDKRPEPQTVGWIDGAICAFRIPDFWRVGGFTEKYFLYFEDVDLGLKFTNRLGLGIKCDSSALASQTTGGNMNPELITRNLLWLHLDHGQIFAGLLFTIESLLRILLGPLIRPSGGLLRSRQRIRGLAHVASSLFRRKIV